MVATVSVMIFHTLNPFVHFKMISAMNLMIRVSPVSMSTEGPRPHHEEFGEDVVQV